MGNKERSASFPVRCGSLQHTFNFDPTFDKVHLKSNSELKFFSEMFSLIDSMRERDTLHQFVTKIRETKGVLECDYIIQMLEDEHLINIGEPTTCSEEGLPFLLESLYQVVYNVVTERFVTCMRTSTLGCMAWQVGQLYLEDSTNAEHEEEYNNNVATIPSQTEDNQLKAKGKAWLDFSERLQDLANHQHKHIKIHHDFQKSNYAPDPRTKTVYGSTFVTIILGILFLCIRHSTISEAREFVNLLNK